MLLLCIFLCCLAIWVYRGNYPDFVRLKNFKNTKKINQDPLAIKQTDMKQDIAKVLKTAPEDFLAAMKKKLQSKIFTVPMNEKQTMTFVLDPNLFSKILHSTNFDFVEISKQSKKRFGFDTLLNHIPTVSKVLKTSLRGAHEEDLLERLKFSFEKHLSLAVNGGLVNKQWKEVSLNLFVNGIIVPALVEALFNSDTHYDGFADDLSDFNESIATRFAGSDPSIINAGEAAQGNMKKALKNILVCDRSTVSTTISTLLDDFLDPLDISDEEKVNFLFMVLWGSLINMQPTNFWMLIHIARQKDLQKEIMAEVDMPSNRRPKTLAALYEVQRLQSRPNIYRYAQETCSLKSGTNIVDIIKGQWVALFPRMMHMDQDIHENPTAFKPERFLNQAMARKPPTEKELLVFGGGRGACPANDYSMRALSSIITSVVVIMELKYEDKVPESRQSTVASTPHPKQNAKILMRLHPEQFLQSV